MNLEASPPVLRRPSINTLVALGWFTLAAIGLGYLIAAGSSGVFGVVLGVVLLSMGGVLGFRGAWAGVILGQDALIIRSALRTRVVPWGDVKKAVPVASTGPIPAAVLGIELADGRLVRVEEIRNFGWLRRGRHPLVDQAVATIEMFARERRSGG